MKRLPSECDLRIRSNNDFYDVILR